MISKLDVRKMQLAQLCALVTDRLSRRPINADIVTPVDVEGLDEDVITQVQCDFEHGGWIVTRKNDKLWFS